MKLFHSSKEAHDFLKKGSAVTIGIYDGVHFGHRIILKKLVKKAKSKKLKSVLLTFDPHPVKILAPRVAPPLISTLKQKLELLTHTGLDAVVVQKFDEKFAHIKPESFFNTILVKDLNAKFVTVGYDFTFGENRTGTIETLELLAYQKKIDVEIIEAQMQGHTLASSSIIRKLIEAGDVQTAKSLLTRPFYIDGVVGQGYHRGTALGIHTANLKTDNELIPGDGVYATRVQVGNKTYKSATNIGKNPTFDNPDRSIETHIFDFNDNIVGKNVRLTFVERLRDEIRFASPSALVTQIGKDIEQAKKALK